MVDPKRAAAFAEHERAQRRARLALTYRERLAWLEQAKAFAAKAQGAVRDIAPALKPVDRR